MVTGHAMRKEKEADKIRALRHAIDELDDCMRVLAALNRAEKSDAYTSIIEKLAHARRECIRLEATLLAKPMAHLQ